MALSESVLMSVWSGMSGGDGMKRLVGRNVRGFMQEGREAGGSAGGGGSLGCGGWKRCGSRRCRTAGRWSVWNDLAWSAKMFGVVERSSDTMIRSVGAKVDWEMMASGTSPRSCLPEMSEQPS